jgi:hypothetical protein
MNMGFKQYLGIEDTSWQGIGRHLARLTLEAMDEVDISRDNLVHLLKNNHLQVLL